MTRTEERNAQSLFARRISPLNSRHTLLSCSIQRYTSFMDSRTDQVKKALFFLNKWAPWSLYISDSLWFNWCPEEQEHHVPAYLCWSPWDRVTGCIQAASPAAACSRPSSRVLGWWGPRTAWPPRAWKKQTFDGSRSVRRALRGYCSAGSSPPPTATGKHTSSVIYQFM